MRRKYFALIVILGVFSFALSACVSPNPSSDPKVPTNAENQQSASDDLDLTNETTPPPASEQQLTQPGEKTMTQPETTQNVTKAVIKTTKGNITLKLYPDQAPNTVANFAQKSSSDFYTNLTFHRVEDWVIQSGDPLGNGTGGGKMPTELNQVPFKAGSLGVARGGDIRVSNDAQFFICTTDCTWLNGQYTNFGEVTEGMDVVKKIVVGDKILGIEISE